MLFFLLLLLPHPISASLLEKSSLHVVSYNIKGLPSFVMGSGYNDARYALIGKLLAQKSSEVVLLQEAFSDLTPSLLAAAGYPHMAEGPGPAKLLGVGSGLYILSQHPIVHEARQAFASDACLSWDCLSNKGVQMVRIALPGLPRPLEVYNTHLQAGREDTSVRRAQVKTLLEFFKKQHQEGNPVIFAGDFNFRPGLRQQSYLDFSKGTGFGHSGKHCLEKGCAKGEDIGWHGIWDRAVDHQFFSLAGEVKLLPLLVERTYREKVEGLKLSDHPAHEVRYELMFSRTSRPIRQLAQDKKK